MTYTKEEARIKIAKLVEDFRAHEATLEKAAEAQIENNFIRPLFRYLNWNTENEGLSHAHYEFKVQVTNKKGLRPDYILNVDGRDVLVMDAKQVKYSMKDPRWLYQVYSYAYSTQNSKPSEKMDFAILTDFQEFIVLDCTLFAAKPEAVNNFRVIDWTYTDYVDKFDELWELFERNHVMDDSRPNVVARSGATKQPSHQQEVASGEEKERPRKDMGLWSRYLSPQKVKANRISPDKAFLAEMDDEKSGWRVLLAKDMKKHNPSADGELITAAVQLLIDRLIFIKALSDREVDRDYLSEIKDRVTEAGLGADDAGWFTSCKTIFEELNNFYNGSIFAPRPELENVSVSNKVVQSVLTDLQPENSPYNFAVLPVEILGTIYERFLGRVVRTTEKQVKIEEKPEVRKAGGVYYTPQYIVDYIVENTLGKLLEEKRPEGFEHDSVESRKPSGRSLTPADVAKLKILDPSCGSGSFLLGAYDKLIEWHKDYFARAGKEKRDRESFYRDESGQIRLTAKLKRDILKNNLFGVDIDPQAVEVTRFSLSLKALEDLREGELTEERTLFHQTVLPDLSQNIKNGNSLVGSDYFTGQMFADTAEMKRVNAFDWKSEFPEIMKSGGFDTVIGNPPYIRIQTMKEWAPLEVEIYKEVYQSAKAGNYDIYVVFVEKALSILNERGRMGYILPHKFFNSQYGAALRGLVASGKHLGKVIHFGDQQVFDGATTYTCLLFLDKKGNDDFEMVRVQDLGAWHNQTSEVFKTSEVSGRILAANVTESEWNFTVGEGAGLFEKLSQMPVKLGDVADLFVGLQTDADDVYILEERRKEKDKVLCFSKYTQKEHWFEEKHLKDFLKGSLNIRRYYFSDVTKRLIFPYQTVEGKSVLIDSKDYKQRFPLTWAYLEECQERLTSRNKGKMGKDWHGYVYKKNHTRFDSKKLLVPSLAMGSCFSADLEGKFYFVGSGGGGGGGYGITLLPDVELDYLYLLGVLNSKMISEVIKKVSTPFQNGYFALNRQYIQQLPIRAIDFNNPAERSQHEKMVALVSQMLELHKSKAGAKTQSEIDVYERQIKSVDGQIDALVYELYGLSEEEIKIVEG